ncbi:ribonuclease HII [Humibacillus sp. DSM 29435]|uniref:ribonuclease HII n=1 Tax=Humibacillus sp. DSM 29435 TaxID=1869167 RepID=UPI0008723C38|nr:ribonuclease HII [Humibacillus sp. DSM 29435]OFE16653.1 ribonuclease HII [Humibacillus sp. DSM 29435]
MTRRRPSNKPSLRVERALQRDGHRLLAGMDEVGRGALAGPVSVGVVVIDESVRSAPAGVKDSKLLTERARTALVPRLRHWALAHAVGHASPDEIDEFGIMIALRLAGTRALDSLDVVPDLVILDGNHDWLTPPTEVGLFAFTAKATAPRRVPPVTTMVKADLKCSSVAAASVLAKVERDDLMVLLGAQHPDYGWGFNKGYAAPEHMDAIARLGPCELHRRSWRLPGQTGIRGALETTDGAAGVTHRAGDDEMVQAFGPTASEQTGTAIT